MDNSQIIMPKHVAIIMDGNRRWAKQRGKSRVSGHNAGALAVRKSIEFAAKSNLESLSLYAFSKENWRRPPEEVNQLMKIFTRVLKTNKSFLNKNNVRLKIIGDIKEFSQQMQKDIDNLERETQNNTGLILNVAINYSGQWDITNATQQVVKTTLSDLKQTLLSKYSNQDSITLTKDNLEQLFNQFEKRYTFEQVQQLLEVNLTVTDQAPIDLIIRTSNEQRLSNFFLWQAAYSEFVFLEQYWPDFNQELFAHTIELFNKRQRRFGGL